MAAAGRCCLWVMALWWSLACLQSCQSQPLRVGFLGGLSGRVADLGVAGRNGAMLAVEQRNAAGGVNGQSVELIVRDDGQDPEQAKKAVSELLEQGVSAIIGPMTSSMAMACLPAMQGSTAVMVSPTVTTKDLAGLDDNFLRVISTTTHYAAKSARYQRQKMGRSRVAVFYDMSNAAYSRSWLEDFQQVFESLGGTVVSRNAFHSGSGVAFNENVRFAMASNPDLMLIIANALDAALICQQVRRQSPDLPIVMSEWASTERFVEMAGGAAEGVMVAQFIDRNDTSRRYSDFLQAYHARFGQDPGFAGMAGYDAAQVVLGGLESMRQNMSLKKAILDKAAFQGVQQVITLDRFGDAERATYITVVKDGRYQTLE